MEESLKNFAFYKKWLIVAAEFNSTEQEPIANVMYSNLALHALPISLNLLMNAILKTYVGEQYSIEIANAPLSGVASTKMPGFWDVEVSISWLMMIPIGKGGIVLFLQCLIFLCFSSFFFGGRFYNFPATRTRLKHRPTTIHVRHSRLFILAVYLFI